MRVHQKHSAQGHKRVDDVEKEQELFLKVREQSMSVYLS